MHVPANPLISLSTDFGPGNKGIGVMKAVILEICPDAQIIDLAHDITGFVAVHEITNPQRMRQPVSAIFHGRDIFAPAAAHLAAGVKMTEVGPAVPQSELATAAYDEAMFEKDHIDALIVDINNFGSV